MRENKSIVFDSIFRRTYSRLYFYALSLLSDESDADDVVEEVFAGLWRRCSAGRAVILSYIGSLWNAFCFLTMPAWKRRFSGRETVRFIGKRSE